MNAGTQLRPERRRPHEEQTVVDADLEDFGRIVAERFGHFQELSRRPNLDTMLRQRMRQTGRRTYAEYRLLLERNAEWEALAPLLTVAETYFFRMPSHFEALADDVLPKILKTRHASRTLRILSAGCATGEEPYSLRILLRERFPQLDDWAVSIVGVDLSQDALERARAGLYTEWSLRATSAERRRSSFVPEGKRFRLKPQARTGVEFRRENLLSPPPLGEPPFDIILCRNVLIYFTEDAIAVAIDRLTERLAPGGYLFLGPAESLRGISNAYQLCQGREVFYYQRRPVPASNPAGSPAGSPAGHPSQAPDRIAEGSPPPHPEPKAAGRSARRGHGPQQLQPPQPGQPASAVQEGSWFASIEESWRRLAALVPGKAGLPALPSHKAEGRAPASPGGPWAESQDQPGEPAAAAAALPQGLEPRAGFQPPLADSDAPVAPLQAREQFAQALDLLETISSGRSSEQPALLHAVMLNNLGRREAAQQECKLLLEADSTDAGAQFLLGLCREQAEAFGEAEEYMAMAVYLDPSFATAHLRRGLLQRRRQDERAARVSIQRALRAAEKESAARLALFGGGLSRQGMEQLCLAELDRLATPGQPAAPAVAGSGGSE